MEIFYEAKGAIYIAVLSLIFYTLTSAVKVPIKHFIKRIKDKHARAWKTRLFC